MRVAVAADHAGIPLNEIVIAELKKLGHEVVDLGTHDPKVADDYPDRASDLAAAVLNQGCERGILICGSGVGVSVAANKLIGIRAAICHDTYSAHQGVEHDEMNVLVMGSRVIGEKLAEDIVKAYLGAVFTNEERHLRRLAKVKVLEQKLLKGRNLAFESAPGH